MRRSMAAMTALAGLLGLGDRAEAQVIYYSTPYYYNSPFNPLVRTYSTPVVYSTYTSPIVVPTRFVYPPFGTEAYAYPPNPVLPASGTSSPDAAKADAGRRSETGKDMKAGPAAAQRAAGPIQPYPAFRQVGFSTYTTAPLPVGHVYYSGDAYNAPSVHFYTQYAYAPYADPYVPYYSGPTTTVSAPTSPPMNYGGYATPYFQVQFGQGYGGWGMGRGWGGWGRGPGWGW